MTSSTFAMNSVKTLSSTRLVAAPRRKSRQDCRLNVRAAEKDNEQKLDFKPNARSGIGYLDEDSAGQTNIFAVEPRTYLKGSRRDETSGISNVVIGAGAAAVGGLVLAAGLLGGGSNASGQASPADEGLQNLSQYSQQFSAGASAPSLS